MLSETSAVGTSDAALETSAAAVLREVVFAGVGLDCVSAARFSVVPAGKTALGACMVVVGGAGGVEIVATTVGSAWVCGWIATGRAGALAIRPGSKKVSDSMVRTKSSISSLLAAMKENVMA